MKKFNFYLKEIYSSMQQNENSILQQINFMMQRNGLYNFAADQIHYATNWLVAKRPDTGKPIENVISDGWVTRNELVRNCYSDGTIERF